MVLEIIDNPEDKQCQATTKHGRRCLHDGLLDGYCTRHFEMLFLKKKKKKKVAKR